MRRIIRSLSKVIVGLSLPLLLAGGLAQAGGHIYCLGDCGPYSYDPALGAYRCTGRCLTKLCTCTEGIVTDEDGNYVSTSCNCD